MSDPAGTFRKFRDANDPAGNLAWSSKMARKGVRANAGAPPDLEQAFGLSDEERVLWRLLALPRKYMDLENTGVLPAEQARSFLRALASADVVDVVEQSEAKPIVPVEIVRLKKALAGQEVKRGASGTTLKPRVYRPDISTPPTSTTAASSAAESKPPEPAAKSPPPKPTPTPPKAAPPTPTPPTPAAEKPAAPPPQVSAEGKQLSDEIERRYAAMASQSYYQFLDVQPSAQPEGIRASYMKLAKMLHPDRISGALRDDPAMAKKADALFKRLQDAWSTLNDPGRRAQYDQNLGSGANAPSSSGKVRRTDEARLVALKADHFVKTKHFKEAEAQYKAALLLDDEYVPALVGLPWAMFLNEARDKKERIAEAKRRLGELADKRRMADAHYKLALIANVEGNEAEHDRRVTLAAKADSNHREAMQEYRLLQRRKNAAKEQAADKGGLFSKLRR